MSDPPRMLTQGGIPANGLLVVCWSVSDNGVYRPNELLPSYPLSASCMVHSMAARCFIYSWKWIESVLNSRRQSARGRDTQNNKEDEEQEAHAARR